MRFWYPLLASIYCVLLCCEAQNKGLNPNLNKKSLLKFFKLNNDVISKEESIGSDQSAANATLNISKKEESVHSSPLKCRRNSTLTLGKENCTKKHNSKTVKKSFRPNDFDDEDDYDDPRDDYEDSPDEEEFSEEDTRGSYRAFEDSPPRPRDLESYEDSSERLRDYESEDDHERDSEYEDEPRDRNRYEDDLDGERDDWDWEPPIRHHGIAGWRLRHHPDDDDEYEPNYYPRYHHHLRHLHYHHGSYRHPGYHASYRAFRQANPSWPSYYQGYQSIRSNPTPYISYPAGWTSSPSSQTNWQSPYLSSAALQSFKTIGPRIINPYLQNTFTNSQQGTNSFFIPPSSRRATSPPYLEATARNVVSFARTLPDIAATLPRLSHDVIHYTRFNPRVISRRKHFGRQLSGPYQRYSKFPDAVLNRIREINLH